MTTDHFLFDAILLADSWHVPELLFETVVTQEAGRLAELDLEPTIEPAFTDPYLPLQF
jgi:hypothetical protein